MEQGVPEHPRASLSHVAAPRAIPAAQGHNPLQSWSTCHQAASQCGPWNPRPSTAQFDCVALGYTWGDWAVTWAVCHLGRELP